MKKCTGEQRETLEKYLLNQLADQEETAFQEHLQECDDCAERLRKIRQLSNTLIPGDKKRRLNRKVIPVWVYVAASLIAGVVVFRFFIPQKPSGTMIVVAPAKEDSSAVGGRSDTCQTLFKPQQQPRESAIAENKSSPGQEQKAVVEDTIHIQTGTALARQYAQTDSTDRFKMIQPGKSRIDYKINAGDTVYFEFKWEHPDQEAAVLLIRNQGEIIDQFVTENDHSFKVDLSKYIFYQEIEWVLMVNGADNMKQGIIVFETE